MEWLEVFDAGLGAVVTVVKAVLESISVLCVILGLVTTLLLAKPRSLRYVTFVAVRRRFGSWLALALEFQLGADILATTIAPSWETLAQLGIIALIRTFLNYFLQKELEAEQLVAGGQRLKTPPVA